VVIRLRQAAALPPQLPCIPGSSIIWVGVPTYYCISHCI
jgi:hypothetical protein